MFPPIQSLKATIAHRDFNQGLRVLEDTYPTVMNPALTARAPATTPLLTRGSPHRKRSSPCIMDQQASSLARMVQL